METSKRTRVRLAGAAAEHKVTSQQHLGRPRDSLNLSETAWLTGGQAGVMIYVVAPFFCSIFNAKNCPPEDLVSTGRQAAGNPTE